VQKRFVSAAAERASVEENVRLSRLIQAYKSHGHLIANLDPLGVAFEDPLRAPFQLQDVKVLQPSFYGLNLESAELKKEFYLGEALRPAIPGPWEELGNVLKTLKATYCGVIGSQFTHVVKPDALAWLDAVILHLPKEELNEHERLQILDQLSRATLFEEYFGLRLSGAKRFSLEGCEALIPGLEALFEESSKLGVRSVEIGMTHRGRLNVLRNVLNVPMEALTFNFQSYLPDDEEHPNNSDDVRYHLGTSVVREFGPDKMKLRVALAANPSHLESVNSVVLGKTRARQFLIRGDTVEDDSGTDMVGPTPKRGSVDYSPSDYAKREAMTVLIHGDASFYQGSVREVLGFSNLRDYTTGGTVHIIINNQIGFTTLPKESHSSIYCSDVALSIGAPVFHVNGNRPEEVVKVFKIAAAYRQKFGRDVVVNIWGYRRHGHNEMDDPGLTQPIMYRKISKLPKVMNLYADSLRKRNLLEDLTVLESSKEQINESFERSVRSMGENPDPKYLTLWNELEMLSSMDWRKSQVTKKYLMETFVTGMDEELLRSYGRAIFTLPTQFNVHPKVKSIYKQRLESIEPESGKNIRWATAEALAFASLLQDGYHIRLSGQDVERGTFNQRHAVIYDQKRSERANEKLYKPWTALQISDWHQQDIRRDLIKRASSSSLGLTPACGNRDEREKEQEEEVDDEDEEMFSAGHYTFPSELETMSTDEDLRKLDEEIKKKIDSITMSIRKRRREARKTQRVLQWREPKSYNPPLGVMEICNSPLSEEAVLGFEHGYSLYSPNILTIWEAQFGDFSNCAQVIIDTFIASGEEKWVRSSGIVLLLPHGFEGQGPDHSSARIERFLQLCAEPVRPELLWNGRSEERTALAKVNMHVLNLSTPAQYFHALRRQMILPVRKPLVIFSPKYLLHHKPCASDLSEFGPSYVMQTVLPDPHFDEDLLGEKKKNVKRVLICSGKIYYNLAHKRASLGLDDDVAILRLEQYVPFPFYSLRNELSKYLCNNDVQRETEICWVQEEPENMGAWSFVKDRLSWVLQNMPLSEANSKAFFQEISRPYKYIGRPQAASPATGSFQLHRAEMERIATDAFDFTST